LKPENIILKDRNKSGIKVIDFGSSCFEEQQLYTYIQSRFYRAPEIVFGIKYSNAIDMWSFGCILSELFTGYPIFPGENEHDQIGYIMEVAGLPPIELLRRGKRAHLFFEPDGLPIAIPNSNGKIRLPNTKFLHEILDCTDDTFLDFLHKCFEWVPEKRLTAQKALRHEWILEGLPPHILIHHMRLHDIQEDDLPYKIKMSLEKYKKSIKKNHEAETERQKSLRTNHENDDNMSSQGSLTNKKRKSRTEERQPKSKNKMSLSTGRSKKHKIDTELSHVSVMGGDVSTVRNKTKQVNIKKGMENSLLDSLSSKSKSNTRNNERLKKKQDLSKSNGDSMKALDELMGNYVVSKKQTNTNQSYVVQKHKIKFKPIRSRIKSKNKTKDKSPMTRVIMNNYKSVPNKVSNATESGINKGRQVQPSRNKMKESLVIKDSKGKHILKNNFFA
jgi:serine/threonine protein kinase